jgi:uncharacterized membrane protein
MVAFSMWLLIELFWWGLYILSNFLGRGLFNFYCGVNLLMTYDMFSGPIKLVTVISSICFLVSGIALIVLGIIVKRSGNTSLSGDVQGYLDKNKASA